MRFAGIAVQVFWAIYDHSWERSPQFLSGKAAKRFAHKFKRTVHVVDATTIEQSPPVWIAAKTKPWNSDPAQRQQMAHAPRPCLQVTILPAGVF